VCRGNAYLPPNIRAFRVGPALRTADDLHRGARWKQPYPGALIAVRTPQVNIIAMPVQKGPHPHVHAAGRRGVTGPRTGACPAVGFYCHVDALGIITSSTDSGTASHGRTQVVPDVQSDLRPWTPTIKNGRPVAANPICVELKKQGRWDGPF